MSILKRLSIVIKGYISATGDRLDQIAAEEELREASAKRTTNPGSVTAAPSAPPHFRPHTIPERLLGDYRLLGLRPEATLDEVEATWRNLALRADPKRFPSGSTEEHKAAEILRSLNEAYARIREHLHPTEGRFGQLEL